MRQNRHSVTPTYCLTHVHTFIRSAFFSMTVMNLNQSYTTQGMQKEKKSIFIIAWSFERCIVEYFVWFCCCRRECWDYINQTDIQIKILICYALDYIVLTVES